VLLTHDPKLGPDPRFAHIALRSDAFYIRAGARSKRTHAARVSRLGRSRAITRRRIRADSTGPIGLDIGAAGPAPRIAVSILSQMIQT